MGVDVALSKEDTMRSALIRDSVFCATAQRDNALTNTEETAEPFTLTDTILCSPFEKQKSQEMFFHRTEITL